MKSLKAGIGVTATLMATVIKSNKGTLAITLPSR